MCAYVCGGVHTPDETSVHEWVHVTNLDTLRAVCVCVCVYVCGGGGGKEV